MIRSFADPETEKIWLGQRSRKLPSDIQNVARRKLRQMNRTANLFDLRIPGGNRFEQLKDYTPLRYSLRINDQWRVTFNWSNGDAHNVRIEDYHRG
ncbi:MAG: type II toxin-antitoxin system RelE/ParE family toxin [Sphingomonadales bacterium]|nr:type II toxin-antitoxin system RelE/ParE family toxin [Sphingomonadales bacterium]PIX67022.1 MAG: plasmid maintenance system killer [Sphingomonadales bacterium CG_4_10_14_3_um_filter_58_15]NCO49461.1 type II toxin-antitoxin system RelE/ParE family toxin [Sphingomonadales bacterium]NCP01306.1 type II toxin-antitoxin system RelE/ParE family toxin [Sphingomonadales bacterium]NCP26638.1 type II toxin-antitoxin system RelE/ParE family toxin [Sphingomonadales bacterium]